MFRQLTKIKTFFILAVATFLMITGTASGQNSKPNILVIMGDDIGIPNISKFSFGIKRPVAPCKLNQP